MNGPDLIALLGNYAPAIMGMVGNVTGALFTAIFLRHNTAAAEFEKIKAGQFKEVADHLLESGKMTYSEYYKANNFLTVARKADEYYVKMHHTDQTTTYDFDWFVRLYEVVGSISDEAMQDLWARILAGEIHTPSTFSFKTIDVLKNLSRKDAELFERICSHSVAIKNSRFLPNYNTYLEQCGIQYGDIMRLSEQGLLYCDSMLVLKMPTGTEQSIVCTSEHLVMLKKAKDPAVTEFQICQFPFTGAGKELASLKNLHASDEDLISFGKALREDRLVEIGVHRIISERDGGVQFENENLIGI